jgi:large subunit ribosomal protein L21
MYAVIKAGGKQQRVKAGDVIQVELMHGGAGETVTFTPILVVDDDGTTHVGKDATRTVVTGKLLGEKKGDKVKVFKYRPKSGYARRQGHRQMLTLVEIQEIGAPARRRAAKKADEATRKAPEEATVPAGDAAGDEGEAQGATAPE